jgi:acyl dehydratase
LPINAYHAYDSLGHMTFVLDGIAGLRSHVGNHLGYSNYRAITQPMVDEFAQVTGDRQWIHVDPERAATGPFGATIVHGLFTLSLGAALAREVFLVEAVRMGVNYGYDRIRYPSPLRVGRQVRLGVDVRDCVDVSGGVQVTFRFSFEEQDAAKPACVADSVVRYFA